MATTGTYSFHWSHPNAGDVHVTGTFDDWTKSVKLEKKGDIWEKTVDLKIEKVLYKFVVDGSWVIDETKPTDTDQNNITNNVLQPSDITPHSSTAPIMSGITPGSTTAALAGQVPKESAKNEVPGAFIETPATERDAPFGVSPIPASSGIGNPITLAPGEKVPDLQGNTIASTVKTDKESYENADSGVAPTQAAPDKSKTNIIPESSLPIGGGNTIQSVGAGSTTAALAGAVPKEPRGVPEVVSESQKEAHVDPEASANTEAVTEKKEVEAELKKTVPEEPATSESGLSAGKIAGIATGTAAAAGAAVVGAAAVAKDKATEVTQSANSMAAGMVPETEQGTAAGVPAVVTDSLKKAHQSPEAASSPEAVKEKSAVEAELEKKVPVENQAGEPAPTATATTSATAPGSTGDVSPLSKPTTTGQTVPAVASGLGSHTTEAKSDAAPETPQKENAEPGSAAGTPTTDSASAAKKSKRRSFFLKIKKILKS